MDKKELFHAMRSAEEEFENMCDTIWGYAEIAYNEEKSCALQMECLRSKGFKITHPVGGIRTAFIAEYGHGKPIVAICGEYDALPGLSQKAGETHKESLPGNTCGHGCGHQMLGTACVEAACAVKQQLELSGGEGTVRYYGCPAEEGGSGKVYMIKAGLFDDVDIALSWHPNTENFVFTSSPAAISFSYRFTGVAAHAAQAPYLGRSALDAAEIMNIGINFLREHLPAGVSIQYAFLDAGGPKPNIVPDHAEVLYTIRALKRDDLDNTYKRVGDIAKGAALITGTTASEPKVTMVYGNIIPNETLEKLFRANDVEADVSYTQQEIDLAEQFCKAIGNAATGDAVLNTAKMDAKPMRGCTDFGDVTQILPGAGFALTTFAAGTALHSWSAVAQGKTGYAHKGMHRAAKILAASCLDLLENPSIVEKAKQEFAQKTNGLKYEVKL